MEKEMLKEIEKELKEDKVLNCFYSICNYYNVDKEIIEKYNKNYTKITPKQKNKSLKYWNIKDLITIIGADEGTWTPTKLPPLAPEASASADSATSASFVVDVLSLRTVSIIPAFWEKSIGFLKFFKKIWKKMEEGKDYKKSIFFYIKMIDKRNI